MLLSMLIILLYLSSQVYLKLVHWNMHAGPRHLSEGCQVVLTYITTKCYFIKLLLLHNIVWYCQVFLRYVL